MLASASVLGRVELGSFSWRESDDAWARVDISIDCVVHYSNTTAFDGARYTKVETTQRCCCLDECRSMTEYGPELKLFEIKHVMALFCFEIKHVMALFWNQANRYARLGISECKMFGSSHAPVTFVDVLWSLFHLLKGMSVRMEHATASSASSDAVEIRLQELRTLLYVLMHLHTYVMLRCCTFSRTCTHTSCYAAVRSHALAHIRHATPLYVFMHLHTYVMLRRCTFSRTCTYTSCYAAVRSHALAHIRHATPLYVLMHLHTYVMLRCCTFSCTCTHTSCYAAVRYHTLPDRRFGC